MKDAKELERGNSKFKCFEVEKSLSVFKLLSKICRIGCRNKLVILVGIGDFDMVWDKFGEVYRVFFRIMFW